MAPGTQQDRISSSRRGHDIPTDETDKIVDATFTNLDALNQARRQPERKSPIKGAHQPIEGTIIEPLAFERITIGSFDQRERSFDVRPLVQEKLAGLKKGETVTMMIDTKEMIIDVALPPQ